MSAEKSARGQGRHADAEAIAVTVVPSLDHAFGAQRGKEPNQGRAVDSELLGRPAGALHGIAIRNITQQAQRALHRRDDVARVDPFRRRRQTWSFEPVTTADLRRLRLLPVT
jgi:hypothetical protein